MIWACNVGVGKGWWGVVSFKKLWWMNVVTWKCGENFF